MEKRTPPRRKERAKTLESDAPHSDVKAHFIGEWMEHLNVKVPDMADELDVTLSQVYRWLKGQKPQADTFVRIADFLEVRPPEALLRPPIEDRVARFFDGRSEEEAKTILEMMEKAWPRPEK